MESNNLFHHIYCLFLDQNKIKCLIYKLGFNIQKKYLFIYNQTINILKIKFQFNFFYI